VRAFAYVLFALTVLLSLAALAAALGRGLAQPPFAGPDLLVLALLFSAAGLLVARARPRNVIGWILLGTGVIWAFGALVDQYALAVLVDGAPDVLGAAVLLGWFTGWGWVPSVMPAVLLVPMFFPEGRLLSPRWWPLPVLGLAGALATATAIALTPGEPSEKLPGFVNPYGVDAPWVGALLVIGFGAMLLALAVTAASLVIRMRRAGAVERQQLKLFFFAALLWPLLIALHFVGLDLPVLDLFALLALPIANGVAILR
jgi:hypothetical protein